MGGDNNITKLNLQQLFAGNILDYLIVIFVFNFSKLQGNPFRYEKISNSLTMPVTFAFHASRVSD